MVEGNINKSNSDVFMKYNEIKSKYKPLKVIGKGNFGIVFLVKNIMTNELFVNKRVSAKTKEELKEIAKEVKLMSKIDSPYVIKLIEYYFDSDNSILNEVNLNIIMEYAGGGDLYSLIQKNLKNKKYFRESEILTYFAQICSGLKAIHDQKILHRDLKSKNIFLTEKNDVKIGDFGLSKNLLFTNDKAITTTGTPYYFSPEILNEEPYSFKSDIWSLGVLLYEMCKLKIPFDATNLFELINNVMKLNYKPISDKFSSDLKKMIENILVIDPDKRPNIDTILKYPLVINRTFYNNNIEFEDDNYLYNKFSKSNKENFNKLTKIGTEKEFNNYTETNTNNTNNTITDEISFKEKKFNTMNNFRIDAKEIIDKKCGYENINIQNKITNQNKIDKKIIKQEKDDEGFIITELSKLKIKEIN